MHCFYGIHFINIPIHAKDSQVIPSHEIYWLRCMQSDAYNNRTININNRIRIPISRIYLAGASHKYVVLRTGEGVTFSNRPSRFVTVS
jgi:hypothetical protein